MVSEPVPITIVETEPEPCMVTEAHGCLVITLGPTIACPRWPARWLFCSVIGLLRRKITHSCLDILELFQWVHILRKFHLINTESDLKWRAGFSGNPHDRSLAVNAFSTEHRILRQLDFYRHHFSHARRLASGALRANHQDAISANVLRHSGQPLRRGVHWRHMAFQFNVHTRALTPVHAIKF